jgi:predicted PurR-regulated permease PerM
MEKERSNHGFGLVVFGILLLAIAFLSILYFKNALVASIIAFLAAIMAAAGWFEARRADGPRTFALTILILSILGAFIILIWSGNVSKFPGKENGSLIVQPPEAVPPVPPADQSKKLKEMEKVIEELEKDTTPPNPDTIQK